MLHTIDLVNNRSFAITEKDTVFVLTKPELQEQFSAGKISGLGVDTMLDFENTDLIAVYKSGLILVITHNKHFKFYSESNLFLTGK